MVNSADGYTMTLAAGGKDACLDELKANARLIAAAPDLLQVAQDFLLLAALHDWEGAAIDFAKATVSKAESNK